MARIALDDVARETLDRIALAGARGIHARALLERDLAVALATTEGEADARRRDVEAQGRAPGLTEQRPRGGAREDGHRCGYYGAIIVRSRWPAQPQQSAAAHGCSNCCWCQMMSCVKQRWGQTSSA